MQVLKRLQAHATNEEQHIETCRQNFLIIFLAIRILKCKKEKKKMKFWRQLSGAWSGKKKDFKRAEVVGKHCFWYIENFWPLKFNLTQISILLKDGRNV